MPPERSRTSEGVALVCCPDNQPGEWGGGQNCCTEIALENICVFADLKPARSLSPALIPGFRDSPDQSSNYPSHFPTLSTGRFPSTHGS